MQESYDIGSQVTLNCTISPTPVSEASSIVYQWYSSVPYLSSSPQSARTITVGVRHPDSADYYCQPLHNGRLLGTGKITLKVKGKAKIVSHCYLMTPFLFRFSSEK